MTDTSELKSEVVPKAEPRATTVDRILDAARECLGESGFAAFSTRAVAERADVPLSQIHYHFRSKQQLLLRVLEEENQALVMRQRAMFEGSGSFAEKWDRACDYLDEDLESGYVRVLQEMIAAGWSDPEVATAVRRFMAGWFGLLADVAERARDRLIGGLGPFTPQEVAALMGLPFTGAEAAILLGFSEAELPARSALRKVGDVIRALEER